MHSGTTKSHNYDLTVLTDKLINLTIQVQEMRLENITRRIQRGRSHYNRPGNRNYSRNNYANNYNRPYDNNNYQPRDQFERSQRTRTRGQRSKSNITSSRNET